MFKKNKKEYEKCIKCGKLLSKSEIKKGASKCENCLGKQAKKNQRNFSRNWNCWYSSSRYSNLCCNWRQKRETITLLKK